MKGGERLWTRERLLDAGQRYRALFESLDRGFCILEMVFEAERRPLDCRFVEVNSAFERQTGMRDVVGRTLRELAPFTEEHWFENFGKVASTDKAVRFESRARALNRWYDVYAFPLGVPAQHRIGVLFNDITARKQTEMALLASEARSRLALDVAQLGTWSWRGAGNVLSADARFCELCGFGPDDTPTVEGALARVHPDDRARVDAQVRAALEPSGEGRFRAEFRCVHPSGDQRWLVSRGMIDFSTRGGERLPARMLGTVMDVTQRKQNEQELLHAHDELDSRVRARTAELARANAALRDEITERKAAGDRVRQLLGQLVDAQEDERRRISRELHDTLGQHLAVLTLGLKAVLAEDGCPPQVKERLNHIEQAVRRLEDDADRLSYELRPPPLDDMGLVHALRHYAQEWSAESGVGIDFQTHGLPQERLSSAVETTVYRVVQESLTNVRKHAGATRVSLIAERVGSELRVLVEDDGCGFDAASVSCSADGRRRFGQSGMAERAALVAGVLQVETERGKGTTVYLSIPLDVSLPDDAAAHHDEASHSAR